ncbi:hypothetical protein [Nonomuraea sp. SBT364]|uniref:hypothetical protein n=1 Tax=Nonomuraea sp. SBT364 TaxID=1580530 RepID=UPI00066CC500|nr:hypothetical protein [Nonomuraea sp. SBT364]
MAVRLNRATDGCADDQVPEGQRDGLRGLADACGSPEPRFVSSADELDVVLREPVIPDDGPADPVDVPAERKPQPKEHEFMAALLTGGSASSPRSGGRRSRTDRPVAPPRRGSVDRRRARE